MKTNELSQNETHSVTRTGDDYIVKNEMTDVVLAAFTNPDHALNYAKSLDKHAVGVQANDKALLSATDHLIELLRDMAARILVLEAQVMRMRESAK